MKLNRRCVFFTLEYTGKEVVDRLRAAGGGDAFNGYFAFDVSDKISADYIIRQLNDAPSGMLAVIDYLQLLDQCRENPDLSEQISQLRQFARDRGLILVFLSQISRSYDPVRNHARIWVTFACPIPSISARLLRLAFSMTAKSGSRPRVPVLEDD